MENKKKKKDMPEMPVMIKDKIKTKAFKYIDEI